MSSQTNTTGVHRRRPSLITNVSPTSSARTVITSPIDMATSPLARNSSSRRQTSSHAKADKDSDADTEDFEPSLPTPIAAPTGSPNRERGGSLGRSARRGTVSGRRSSKGGPEFGSLGHAGAAMGGAASVSAAGAVSPSTSLPSSIAAARSAARRPSLSRHQPPAAYYNPSLSNPSAFPSPVATTSFNSSSYHHSSSRLHPSALLSSSSSSPYSSSYPPLPPYTPSHLTHNNPSFSPRSHIPNLDPDNLLPLASRSNTPFQSAQVSPLPSPQHDKRTFFSPADLDAGNAGSSTSEGGSQRTSFDEPPSSLQISLGNRHRSQPQTQQPQLQQLNHKASSLSLGKGSGLVGWATRGGEREGEKISTGSSTASGAVGGTRTTWARWWKRRKSRKERERLNSGGKGGGGDRSTGAGGGGWLNRPRWLPRRKKNLFMLLVGIAAFVWYTTTFLLWFFNPDKIPLPYRSYCLSPHPTYHSLSPLSPSSYGLLPLPLPHLDDSSSLSSPSSSLPTRGAHPLLPSPLLSPSSRESDELEPVGLFVGVFSTDKAFERRQMIRSTWARQVESGERAMESVRVRFILGVPRRKWKSLIELEMETYGDIVVLEITENMNSGKTHAFFSWAAENAMVSSSSSSASTFYDRHIGPPTPAERRPDFVAKADDDSFVMLGEMEKRLRVLGKSKIYWGYLIKNLFMGGECYALSLDLVSYVASSPLVRTLISGAEDKLVARWMKLHPDREKILWVSESCWIYDHPKAGTVYSHGFLFPDEVERIRRWYSGGGRSGGLPAGAAVGGPGARGEMGSVGKINGTAAAIDGFSSSSPLSFNSPSSLAFSSVSTFHKTYTPPLPNLTPLQRIEALIEGSEMSLLSPYSSSSTSSPLLPETVMARRPTMAERYMDGGMEGGRTWGKGTVVVHYVKRKEWFMEVALALLGSGLERLGVDGAAVGWRAGKGGRKEWERMMREEGAAASAGGRKAKRGELPPATEEVEAEIKEDILQREDDKTDPSLAVREDEAVAARGQGEA